eukprot:1140995-Pelagomonas_calceolata.AAC.5
MYFACCKWMWCCATMPGPSTIRTINPMWCCATKSGPITIKAINPKVQESKDQTDRYPASA